MAYGGINISQAKLTPKSALVVYERSNPIEDDYMESPTNDMPEFYVESHSIALAPDGKFRLGEGSPITYEAVGRLAHAFSEQAASLTPITGLLPANLLSVHQSPGKLNMLWYDKPMKRNFLYQGGDVMFQAPAMLYQLREGRLMVYATDATGRPTAKTNVYYLPWSNMSGGSVCLGTAEFKRACTTYKESVQEWTKAFWMSRFSMGSGEKETKHIIKLGQEGLPYPVDKLKKVSTFAHFTRGV